ncbi:MAG: hypothetical protein GOV02_02580 [Candidatus Aenigmarchaeota archaeon]|nr:hypothetical protein [Candidatus Aenigmarchaeota archaeon]
MPITKALARIHAHVCADGWLCCYIEKNALQIVRGRRYHRDRKKYEIGYCNTDESLLEQFKKDMRKTFDINTRRNKFELRTRSKRVFEILSILGAGNSRNWFVGHEIIDAGKIIKRNWIRAFFDDEATVDTRFKRIRVKSVNFNGLKQVKDLLDCLSIKSHITGENIDNTWYLSINGPDVSLYHKKVGFFHKKRAVKLAELVA